MTDSKPTGIAATNGWLGIAAIAAVTLVTLGWRLAAGAHPVDDAYITFRYARNLAQGVGLVYNPGERVLATTTPATAVMLAGGAVLLGPDRIPQVAFVLNAIFDSFSVVFVVAIARRLQFSLTGQILAALLFAFSPIGVRYSIGGMEAPLAGLLALATVYLFLTGQRLAAATVAALGIWVRPDLLAVGAALATVQVWQRDRRAWQTLLLLLTSILIFTMLLSWGYGSPVPQSMIAKAAPIYRSPLYANAIAFIYTLGRLPFLAWLEPAALPWAIPQRTLTLLFTGFFVMMSGAWFYGMKKLIRSNRDALILGLYPAIFIGTYVALGLRGTVMSEWYIPPLVGLWVLPIVRATQAVLGSLRIRAVRVGGAALFVVLLTPELAGFDLGRGIQPSPVLPLSLNVAREHLYAEAARFLTARMEPGEVVAASEIGALGYACDCRILDTAGLITPEALRYYPLPRGSYVANYAIPSQLITDARPRYLVSLDAFMARTLLADPKFLEDYELLVRFPIELPDSRELLIYGRRWGR